jgi:hypothetical protein
MRKRCAAVLYRAICTLQSAAVVFATAAPGTHTHPLPLCTPALADAFHQAHQSPGKQKRGRAGGGGRGAFRRAGCCCSVNNMQCTPCPSSGFGAHGLLGPVFASSQQLPAASASASATGTGTASCQCQVPGAAALFFPFSFSFFSFCLLISLTQRLGVCVCGPHNQGEHNRSSVAPWPVVGFLWAPLAPRLAFERHSRLAPLCVSCPLTDSVWPFGCHKAQSRILAAVWGPCESLGGRG